MLSQNDIIYFIMTDRFCDGDPDNNFDVNKSNPNAYHGGDFQGIINKIPYLKNLGVTAVWITPVCVNINNPEKKMWGYHGYWPLDFDRTDPRLYSKRDDIAEGSKRYLRELVDTLHAAGLKVILDMVVNHTGYDHPGLSGADGTVFKPHWFNPAYLESVEEGRMMGLPDLDQDNMEVVDHFTNMIIDWIEETGIDCIRMDTAKHVERAFWYHYKTYVKGKYAGVSLLGEVLEWDIDRISEFQKYYAFDYLFDFPLQQAMTDVFINDRTPLTFAYPHLSANETLGVLDKDTHYTNHNRLVTLLDNHDLPKRFFSAAVDRYGGNREAAAKIYKLALSFLMTTRGVPQIFYGDEIGMEGYADPDNRRDMPWEIFGDGMEPTADHPLQREIFTYLKNLIAIRKENEAIPYGSLTTLYVDSFIYAYLREFRDNIIIVVLNNGREPMFLPLLISMDTHSAIPPRVKDMIRDRLMADLLDPSAPSTTIENGSFNVRLDGKSAKIYKVV